MLVARAEADAECIVTLNIVNHTKKSWRAGYWFLKTRYPSRWGPNAVPSDDLEASDAVDDQLPTEAPSPQVPDPNIVCINRSRLPKDFFSGQPRQEKVPRLVHPSLREEAEW